MLLTCTTVGTCNVWQQTSSCSATSLVCGNKSGSADCECAANATSTFYADAVNGSVGAALPFPTGINSPAQCRFKTLTSALTLANAAAVAGPATVLATGQTGVGTEVFNAETFPLNVNTNVTLSTTDVAPTPANYIINFTDSTAGQNAVIVHDLGSLSGMTIQNVNGANNNSQGISTACPASPAGVAKVSNVVVIGKSTVGTLPALAAALNVASNCSVNVDSTDLRTAGFGLRVAATSNATAVTFTNGTIDSNNAVGVFANRGVLTLNGTNVKASGLEGIRINPNGGEVVFAETGGVVENNVQNGLSFLGGVGATNASTAVVTNTEIRNNGGFGIGTIAPRPLSLVAVNVHGNTSGGLNATTSGGGGPAVTVTGASHFDTNGSNAVAGGGVSVTGGGSSITATGTTFSGNRGSGVHVGGGGDGKFTSITVNGNGAGQAAGNNPGAFEVENQSKSRIGLPMSQKHSDERGHSLLSVDHHEWRFT